MKKETPFFLRHFGDIAVLLCFFGSRPAGTDIGHSPCGENKSDDG